MKVNKTEVLLCTAFLFVPGLSQAQSSGSQHPLLTAKYQIAAGTFVGDGDYTISADGSASGADIDFASELGVDDSQSSALAVFHWRFREKWSLQMQAFQMNMKGGRVLDHDIEFGDSTFRDGSNVSAGIKISVVRAFFGRSFSTGPQHEFGAGLGFHRLVLGASVSGEVFINDQSPSFRKESVDASLPLPNIGAWYHYAPTNRWLLTARVDWLSASMGDYDGGLWNVGFGAQFQVTENFGIGGKYRYFELNGDVDKSNWAGSAKISTAGPLLYFTANW